MVRSRHDGEDRQDRDGEALSFEAVRDLLGVVRALYVAAKTSGAGAADLARISRVGGELRKALDMAKRSRPGTLGFASACRRAERAALSVADLVDALTPAEPLVLAARARVSGARPARRTKVQDR